MTVPLATRMRNLAKAHAMPSEPVVFCAPLRQMIVRELKAGRVIYYWGRKIVAPGHCVAVGQVLLDNTRIERNLASLTFEED